MLMDWIKAHSPPERRDCPGTGGTDSEGGKNHEVQRDGREEAGAKQAMVGRTE